MIFGYLTIGFLSAVMSTTASLTVGFGFFATIGFYILGGALGMMIAASLAVMVAKAQNNRDRHAEGLARNA